ncbi:hypothetical protein BDZ97DRAFT_1764211 [Flammula alnicola]|nr:hypothetical protein BDZ97DRAFT_1764211 [Flammula alnicola]
MPINLHHTVKPHYGSEDRDFSRHGELVDFYKGLATHADKNCDVRFLWQFAAWPLINALPNVTHLALHDQYYNERVSVDDFLKTLEALPFLQVVYLNNARPLVCRPNVNTIPARQVLLHCLQEVAIFRFQYDGLHFSAPLLSCFVMHSLSYPRLRPPLAHSPREDQFFNRFRDEGTDLANDCIRRIDVEVENPD